MRTMTPYHRDDLAAELREVATDMGFVGLFNFIEPQERDDGRPCAPDRNPERTR